MDSSPFLRLRGVVKSFGTFTALDRIDLDINEGEFFTIVGPSGSGKSTLIRLLVGMDDLTAGEIRLRDKRIDDTPANLRPTCMVFQSLALFPHMTVGQNIEFPLKLRKEAPAARKAKALELLDLVKLPREFADRMPRQLSGGQKQRIPLARAIILQPQVIILDEALASLDPSLRSQMINLLLDLQQQMGLAFILISHNLGIVRHFSDDMFDIRHTNGFLTTRSRQQPLPCTRFINHVYRFIWQVTLINVFGRQLSSCLQSFVGIANAMVFFIAGFQSH